MNVLASWLDTKVSRDAYTPVEGEHRVGAVCHGRRLPQRRADRSACHSAPSVHHLCVRTAHAGKCSPNCLVAVPKPRALHRDGLGSIPGLSLWGMW